MRRIHYVVVQLEEAKRLLQSRDVAYLRMALILLDNAAEMILHRAASGELRHAEMYDRMLKNFPPPPLDERMTELHKDIRTRAIDAKRRENIKRFFAPKTRLLVQRGRLPAPLARVVNHLHGYRNDAFHAQTVRRESIAPATLILFDVTCELFLCLPPGSTSYSSDEDHSWLHSYGIDSKRFLASDELIPTIVSRLRADLSIDTNAIREALSDHMDSRLTELEAMLGFIVTNATAADSLESLLDVLQNWAEGRRDAMRQAGEPEPPAIRPRRTLADVRRWRADTLALRKIDDRLEMFGRFATIEDEFEPIEKLVLDVAADVEMAIQYEIDRRRGK